MGKIANSSHEDALEIFRKILLASFSMPCIFPPVYIDVEVDRQFYDEMHVDGGVITQVFFHATVVNIEQIRKEMLKEYTPREKGEIYIILNGTVHPIPEKIDRNILNITERTLSTMIKASAISDLRRIYMLSKKEDLEINFIGIPEDFEFAATEAFDRLEMLDLYKLGYKIGSSSNRWQQNVPWVID